MSSNNIKDGAGYTPAHYWAIGGMCMLILLGIGGCEFLSNYRVNTSAKAPSSASTPSR